MARKPPTPEVTMDEPVQIRPDADGTLQIELAGDIDYTNSSAVVNAIKAAIQGTVGEPGPTAIRIDLDAVTFLDSSGIGVLIITNQLADSLGAAYTVVRPGRNVFEQLRLTGLVDLFGIAAPGE
jgi:anti-sigma B factor antagonist